MTENITTLGRLEKKLEEKKVEELSQERLDRLSKEQLIHSILGTMDIIEEQVGRLSRNDFEPREYEIDGVTKISTPEGQRESVVEALYSNQKSLRREIEALRDK